MIGVISFIAVVLGVVYWRKDSFVKNGDLNSVGLAKTVGLAILFGAIAGNLGGAIVIVPSGHKVVVFDNITGVKPRALGEGINFVTPFIQTPIEFDVRVQKAEFDATAASKDLQDVATKVTLNFHPDAEHVVDIYRGYGVGFTEKVIHPAVQEAAKAVTALYTAEELIIKREQVKNQIQEHLAALLHPANLVLDQTYITDFKFSEAFSHAIEQKQVAEQDALKARRDLDRVRLESEQKISQLRAEAEGLRMQKEQISPSLVQLRAVEKWDGHFPQVMMGGSVPMVNMDSILRRDK